MPAPAIPPSAPSVPVLAAPPSAMPGLSAWFSAASIVQSDGTAVASWPDKVAGNGAAVQATGSKQPTYYTNGANGQPGVYLNSAAQQAVVFPRQTGIMTLVVVSSFSDPQGITTNSPLIGDSTDASLAGNGDGSAFLVKQIPSNDQPLQTLTANCRMNGLDCGSLEVALKPRSLTVTTIRFPAGFPGAFSTIAYDRFATFTTKGTYAEVALFTGTLTDVQVEQVERYFAAQYAIPYRSKPSYAARAYGVGMGDSLMLGLTSTLPHLQAIQNAFGATRYAYRNLGIGGTTAVQWRTKYFGQYLYKFPSTYPFSNYNQAVPGVLHLWVGTNDLNASATPAATYAELQQLWAMARGLGYKVVAYTIMSRGDNGVVAGFDAARASLNALIRSDPSQYDALVDVAANSILGPDGVWSNTTYFSDKVHLTNAGQQIVGNLAAAVYPSLGL